LVTAVVATAVTLGTVLLGTAAFPDAERVHTSAVGDMGAIASVAQDRSAAAPAVRRDDALPPASGAGRRIVFAIGAQRVWLVGPTGSVQATYLVSGSRTPNLRHGHYAVYSRSRWAVGVDGSGVMQYFVRFTRGAHAAIGFHSIPTKHGRPLQTRAELGTPRSHGCIRQALPDAVRLWRFAPVGTPVVVTA
jgi:lipoprotein-anchoring transpeptidase ErfK/SrfK